MHRKYRIATAVCVLFVIADQTSKTIIKALLAPNGRVPIINGVFDLNYAENTGMAFGMLQNMEPAWIRTPLFTAITVIALIIIVHLLSQTPERSFRLPIGLGLILSGAFGNLIDRFRWGVVVDFIRVKVWPPANFYWPTFNLADTFITLGIVLLLLDTIFAREELAEEPAEEAPQPGEDLDVALETGEDPGDAQKEQAEDKEAVNEP